MNVDDKTLSIVLRVVGGSLAVACFVLVFLRVYSLFVLGVEASAAERFVHVLRILFPLSLGLIAAYVAFTGNIPFTSRRDRNAK
jgi:hypothetical protein